MTVVGSVDIGEDVRLVAVDHNPTVVATNAPKGSMIIDINGEWYRKIDDGATTNVELPIPGANDPTGMAVEGFESSYVSVSSVSIAAGTSRDSTGAFPIVSASPVPLDVTVSGLGGLDTGVEAINTWYAQHIIADSSGVNPINGVLSISETAPTLPGGYDVFRHAGWVRNDAAGDFHDYRQAGNGNMKIYDLATNFFGVIVLSGGTATVFTPVDCSSICPPTSTIIKLGHAIDTSVNTDSFDIRPTGASNEASMKFTRPGFVVTGFNNAAGQIIANTDASQSIDYKVTGTPSLLLWGAGFIDFI